MKRFQFSLEAVKDYKEQMLEERKREHGLIVQAVAEQERVIRALEMECAAEIEAFNQKKQAGMTIIDAQGYETHIRLLQKRVDKEREKLYDLQQREMKKQQEVVLAKQEVSSLEKLRDRKIGEYNKAVMKEEELFIDEIVSHKRATAI